MVSACGLSEGARPVGGSGENSKYKTHINDEIKVKTNGKTDTELLRSFVDQLFRLHFVAATAVAPFTNMV